MPESIVIKLIPNAYYYKTLIKSELYKYIFFDKSTYEIIFKLKVIIPTHRNIYPMKFDRMQKDNNSNTKWCLLFHMISNSVMKLISCYEKLFNTNNFTIADDVSLALNYPVEERVNGNEGTQADKSVQTPEGKYLYKCWIFVHFTNVILIHIFNLYISKWLYILWWLLKI